MRALLDDSNDGDIIMFRSYDRFCREPEIYGFALWDLFKAKNVKLLCLQHPGGLPDDTIKNLLQQGMLQHVVPGVRRASQKENPNYPRRRSAF